MRDEDQKKQELCKREIIEQVRHLSFYKNVEKIHKEGMGPDQLIADDCGDNHSAEVQPHSREDVGSLIDQHKVDHKSLVLDLGLKHCRPCVKVYPTVIKLSRQMSDDCGFCKNEWA